MTPAQALRAAYSQAKGAGCTCRPSIAYRPSGIVEVGHDDDCRLATFGQTAIHVVSRDGVTPVMFDLTAAIELALRGNVIVASAAEGVLVVPESLDVPPTIAEWCDIQRVARPDGRVARVCTIPDHVLVDMLARGGATRSVAFPQTCVPATSVLDELGDVGAA